MKLKVEFTSEKCELWCQLSGHKSAPKWHKLNKNKQNKIDKKTGREPLFENGWTLCLDTGPCPKMCEKPLFCLLYTSPSPRDGLLSRMPSSA